MTVTVMWARLFWFLGATYVSWAVPAKELKTILGLAITFVLSLVAVTVRSLLIRSVLSALMPVNGTVCTPAFSRMGAGSAMASSVGIAVIVTPSVLVVDCGTAGMIGLKFPKSFTVIVIVS